jgi:Ca2+-binding RTX toxin-like protein
MRQGLFGWPFRARRDHKTAERRREFRVEALEARNLLTTAGSVVQSGSLVTINPATTGTNVAVVSYQNVKGTNMLNVNLNGSNYDFSLSQVGFVYYEGSSISGAQTFQNLTSLHTVAWGGSGTNHFESGGNAQDEFFGGSGTNTFDAGTGFDVFFGGSGANTYNESLTGSGEIIESGTSNIINVPPGATGTYYVMRLS